VNPLRELQAHGQSIWLDYIRRSLLTSGELQRLVEVDGLRGVTSNPTIFQKAIAGSTDYDARITEMVTSDPHIDAPRLFEVLSIEDIQRATDQLRPVYEATGGVDGYVSLELSPHLAHDVEGSLDEARRLWATVNRRNLMLKVPATAEGVAVIEALTAEGINVNATLLFSLSHYEAVAQAYLSGLEACTNPQRIASVASVFLSRIDRVVDAELEAIAAPPARQLQGRIAVANAKMIYRRFQGLFSGTRWERLAAKGARVQRLLWASTSTKNPAYSDLLYVEQVIGPHTVNTLPPGTLNAFRDHGTAHPTLQAGVDAAEAALERLAQLGVNLPAVTEALQVKGVQAFTASYDALLTTLAVKRQAILHDRVDRVALSLGAHRRLLDERLALWNAAEFLRRLWAKDFTLWFAESQPEITDRLGWLVLPEVMHEQIDDFCAFAEAVRAEGTCHVVLLGMGGSSLAPEVFQQTYGNAEGFPELVVLDSTHPEAIAAVEARIDLRHTLFLVSSKSGSTIETLSLYRYFWRQVSQVDNDPGRHFVAITDPQSSLAVLAQEQRFKRVFRAHSDVGGRYSALTAFGLVPAALIGMDVHGLLDRAGIMAENSAFCVPPDQAQGLHVAAALGELAKLGRDKVTILTSPTLARFPVWLEQLIAESTGKDGKGLVPVVNEPLAAPDVYGADRLFVYLSTRGESDAATTDHVDALVTQGHPVVRITLTDTLDLGQELFSWELAIAAVGAILGIHPFNQPNVQMAKDLAREMMAKAEAGMVVDSTIDSIAIDDEDTIRHALHTTLSGAQPGDYLAIQAFLPPTPSTMTVLQALRSQLLTRHQLTTTLGYGPRFLHSTGQLHKGGPNNGIFIQLIDEPALDLDVPGTDYTFGTLVKAQALGDYKALTSLDRRVVRVNLKGDVPGGLSKLLELTRRDRG
jgi:transaldolase/glucose-6-phosphate isomerase